MTQWNRQFMKAAVLAGVVILSWSSVGRTDFEDLGMGARPFGMGGAFTGLADDVRAIYYNPAGLGCLRRSQLGADYSRLYVGLSDDSVLSLGFIAFAQPFHRSEKQLPAGETVAPSTPTAGGPPSTGTVSSLSPTQRDYFPRYGTLAVAVRSFSLDSVYREETAYLSYGKALNNHLSIGVGLKLLQETYDQDLYTQIDPVFDYGNKNSLKAFSSDVGLLWNPQARFFWGASVLDLNRPDVGLKETDALPSSYKTGLGYRDNRTALALDFTSRGNQTRFGLGGERWFTRHTWAVRTGLEYGRSDMLNVSMGFSVNMSIYQIDYGVQFPLAGIQKTAGSHRLSLLMRFGAPQKDELDPGSLEYSYLELKQEKMDIEGRLQKTEAEKQRLEEVLLEEATQRIRERIQQAKRAAGAASAPAGPSVSAPSSSSLELRTHYVKDGDTLQNLAGLYFGDVKRWKDIYEANKEKLGRGGRLKSGTVLLIPQAPVTASRPEPASSPKEEKSAPAPEPSAPKVLKAQPAEKPAVVLKPEVKPSLPVGPAPAPAAVETLPSPAPAPSAAGRTHTVKEGETLKGIAEKYYGDAKRWTDIYKENKNKISRGMVNPGDVLTIP